MRLGAALLLAGLAIGALVELFGAPRADATLVEAARAFRDGGVGVLMRGASTVGYARWLAPLLGVAMLVVGWRSGRWSRALLLAVAVPLAALLSQQLKLLWGRPRPEGGIDVAVSGFAMPSGHATAATAFAVALVLSIQPGRARRIAAVAGGCFTVLVCASRVVLGVHWPTDVIAGACLGAGVALCIGALAAPARRV